MDCNFGGRGSVGAFFEETGEIAADDSVDRFFDGLWQLKLAGEVIWVGVAGGNQWDIAFVSVAKHGEGDWSGGLIVDKVRLKLVENGFNFEIRVKTNMKAIFIKKPGDFFAKNSFHFGYFVDLIWVKRQFDTRETGDLEVVFGVFFYGGLTGDAGGEDDNFVTTLAETGSKIA